VDSLIATPAQEGCCLVRKLLAALPPTTLPAAAAAVAAVSLCVVCVAVQLKAEAELEVLQQCSFTPITGRGPQHR
jgi:hypothetical protein